MIKYCCIILIGILLIGCKENSEKKEESYVVSSDSKIKKTAQHQKGKEIYNQFCAQCHLPTGKGIPKIYPKLRGSNWLTEKRKESIHAVKYGLSGEITVNGKTYENIMTPLGLSDEEVVEVMNYIMNAWENKQDQKVTLEEVKAVKK